jgi:3-methyladenine DNA glycosylase AlkD
MQTVTKIHNDIKAQVAKLPHKKMSKEELEFLARYLGSSKKYLGAKTGDVLSVAKQYAGLQSELSTSELTDLLSSLFFSDTFEEHAIGGKIFTLLKPEIRKQIPFFKIRKWLSKARGWVEVDVICQSSFTGKEVEGNFAKWEKAIEDFSQSKIISLRRASLVLQTKPVREVNNPKMRQLAYKIIDKTKLEKDILITKAVSWLLRSLTVQDKNEVKSYLEANKAYLPAIAYRETMKKILTGKKSK